MPVNEPASCHDCGCVEGEIHELGCDMERCPFCGGQLISCTCCYEKLGIDVSEGTWAYEHGLTPEQDERWLALVNQAGRIPYIQWLSLCAYCGTLWPPMFHVPDEEWAKYIEPGMRGEMVCRGFYDFIKSRIDAGSRRQPGDPVDRIDPVDGRSES